MEIKFRVVELKTPRFSTAIGSNLYPEDRVEYFSVYYYYYYFFIPQVVKIPGVKTTKAKIKMSDGQRSGRSTGRVSCKSIIIIIIIFLTLGRYIPEGV